MPLWSASARITKLSSGRPVTVFDAEVLSDGNKSSAVALPPSPSGQGLDISYRISFASAPSTVDFNLQIAMNNVEAEFVDSGDAITSTSGGLVIVPNVVARFARLIAVDADTKAVTGEIMVN